MAVESTSKLQTADALELRPEQQLDNNLQTLEKFGAFDLLESVVDGIQNLNPERKARKKIFLEEAGKKEEREQLQKTLEIWLGVLKGSEEITDMVAKSNTLSEQAAAVYKNNMNKALEATRQLETSYRSVALFFKNTESAKVKNVHFINVEIDQLKDLNNTRFIDYIRNELVDNYDRLDLRNNYGILIIPGYLGSNMVVEKWAKM